MSTTEASNSTHFQLDDLYDPDGVVPKNSPELKPLHPKIRLTPPQQPPEHLTVSPPSSPDTKKSNRRMKVRPSQGDAVLVSALDGGRRPELALRAAYETLAYESDTSGDSDSSCDTTDSGRSRHSDGGTARDRRSKALHPGVERMAVDSTDQGDVGAFDLKSLAAGALAFASPDPNPEPEPEPAPAPAPVAIAVAAGPTPPVTEYDVVKGRPVPTPLSHTIAIRQGEPMREDRHVAAPVPSPYSPQSLYSPRDQVPTSLAPPVDARSPPNGLPPNSHGEGLPPMLNSPRSETSGQATSLPPIRAHFGDLQLASISHVTEKDRLRGSHHPFPRSPPTLPRLPSIHHASPPISPAETFRREPISPYAPVTSPYYPQTNGFHRSPHDYSSSTAETPGSDQSASTPATSVTDKMSIEGITTHSSGIYVCRFAGCTAAPFQTQYLLNSHANVHSSARPHYCPVAGCPRSEGGKGFKRKNEMIRHGLVHDSPGYVCPFCPDREHKYPRPDNLQR